MHLQVCKNGEWVSRWGMFAFQWGGGGGVVGMCDWKSGPPLWAFMISWYQTCIKHLFSGYNIYIHIFIWTVISNVYSQPVLWYMFICTPIHLRIPCIYCIYVLPMSRKAYGNKSTWTWMRVQVMNVCTPSPCKNPNKQETKHGVRTRVFHGGFCGYNATLKKIKRRGVCGIQKWRKEERLRNVTTQKIEQ